MKKIGVIAGLLIAVGVATFFGTQKADECEGYACEVEEMKQDDNSQASSGMYVDYSDAALASATENGRAVLFFKANWCSTCSVLDKELINEEGELPIDATILKLDYDKEKELKKKYGVTIQHTLVLVDDEGEEAKKWVGGGIETIKQQIK